MTAPKRTQPHTAPRTGEAALPATQHVNARQTPTSARPAAPVGDVHIDLHGIPATALPRGLLDHLQHAASTLPADAGWRITAAVSPTREWPDGVWITLNPATTTPVRKEHPHD